MDILSDEVFGRTKDALSKMDKGYTMTWMYGGRNGALFSKVTIPGDGPTSDAAKMEDAYHIEGRTYEIMNIAESSNLVMVELIESYPDPDTKKIYRTPLVLVLEMHDGKINTGRHYCDPDVSYMHLTKKQTDPAYENPAPKVVIGDGI